jgi:hypothetical protein
MLIILMIALQTKEMILGRIKLAEYETVILFHRLMRSTQVYRIYVRNKDKIRSERERVRENRKED